MSFLSCYVCFFWGLINLCVCVVVMCSYSLLSELKYFWGDL